MADNSSAKQFVKILIGAAWIDGQIQPEERKYLQQVAKDKGLADDAEIQLLLFEFRTVHPKECYQWIREYLGEHPSAEDFHELIEAISMVVYSDGVVAIEEARLLTNIKLLDPANTSSEPAFNNVLKAVQELYQRWLGYQN
ncbi:TerB family tellurite resistance protein [Microcoleus sp. FACHB-672]|uniref:tellurite resistance TerB family protein n=1 Tax=Microcoleus sp. FACHB-672 TaxID=2692825 RepID=UPI001685F27E|nr:TerB family tellurite resistance protein [Microcoleus sp. FACHB-672]MBD2043804.1 TerB family tellurite resistance protein [Microcoleus sp. FACHB-672]